MTVLHCLPLLLIILSATNIRTIPSLPIMLAPAQHRRYRHLPRDPSTDRRSEGARAQVCQLHALFHRSRRL